MNLTNQQIQHMVDTMSVGERKSWIQNEGYQAWLANNCRGTMEMATGVGKTRIGIRAAAEELERNPDALIYIIVPTETLRDVDWPAEMKEAGYEGLEKKVKMICWASLGRQKPKRDVDLVVLDELHHITVANSRFFISDDYKVFKILGLTATVPDDKYDDDKDKLILINAYCPSVYQVTLDEAARLKIIANFQFVVLTFDLDNTDPYIRGGTSKAPKMVTEYQQYQYLTKQLQRATYTQNEGLKFVWIQKRTAFLYNLRTKARLAREVLDKVMTNGERTLIFCGSIEQSRQLCGKQVYHSDVSDEHLSLFREEKINYLGVVQALNEGKNLPNMDQILVVQLTSKERNLIQRTGRTVRWREDIPDHVARIILLVAKGTVDEKWYKSAIQNFDRSRIKEYHVKSEVRSA